MLLHDGFYGCGTGAGVSNRRFLEVLVTLLKPGCRLVVMPVWVAEDSNEYDGASHAAMQAVVHDVGGSVVPLDNGTGGRRRFGSIANWRRLAASAELHLRAMGLDERTLVIGLDIPFLELPGRLGHTPAQVVFVPRSSIALHQVGQAEVEWELECYRRMVSLGTRIGLISAFMGRHLAAACGVPSASMIRVFDGVTRSEWSDQVPAIPLPPGAERGFMLTMGRAHLSKGFDELLDAVRMFHGRYAPHVVMAAVTEDDERSEYQDHLGRRIVAERLDVTLITRFSWGVRSLIGHPALNAVIVPSRVEPFGRIPMEVYSHPSASGVAVIASAVGGLQELVIEGSTGFSFPAGCSGGLAAAIVRALSTPAEERVRLHMVGRHLVAERHTFEANVVRFLRMIATAG